MMRSIGWGFFPWPVLFVIPVIIAMVVFMALRSGLGRMGPSCGAGSRPSDNPKSVESPTPQDPLVTLRERYARGEIDTTESSAAWTDCYALSPLRTVLEEQMTSDNPTPEGHVVAQTPDPTDLIASQLDHWEAMLSANPDMFGLDPSEAGYYAASRFVVEELTEILELGAGQGRDTLGFLRAGLQVHALDYAGNALAGVEAVAGPELVGRLTTTAHDVRRPLPFADGSFDACYSHMLFTMALTTTELEHLAGEVHRVLRPGGLCVYTVRHTGDAHYGAGRDLGDNLYENGGFVVHFFDRALVKHLATGFELDDITDFEEGGLPRRLWRVTMRRS